MKRQEVANWVGGGIIGLLVGFALGFPFGTLGAKRRIEQEREKAAWRVGRAECDREQMREELIAKRRECLEQRELITKYDRYVQQLLDQLVEADRKLRAQSTRSDAADP